MSNIAIGIAHTPDNEAREAILQHMLAGIPKELPRVISAVKGPCHVWSEAQWNKTENLATLVGADHCLFLNDDLTIEDSFWEQLPRLVAARPDDVICFHHPHDRFATLYEEGADWVQSWDGMVGNMYLLPVNVLRNFLMFRRRDMRPEAVVEYNEDAQIALYCMAKHRPILHPMPSPFKHAEVPSTWQSTRFKYHNPPVQFCAEGLVTWPATWDTPPRDIGRVWAHYHWQLRTHLTPAAVKEYDAISRMYWLDGQHL